MLASTGSQGCNPLEGGGKLRLVGRLQVANKGPRGASSDGCGTAAFLSLGDLTGAPDRRMAKEPTLLLHTYTSVR